MWMWQRKEVQILLQGAQVTDQRGDVHAVPLGDYREHEASSNCWCKPRPDEEEPRVFIHNAMDGRESYEQGRKLQ